MNEDLENQDSALEPDRPVDVDTESAESELDPATLAQNVRELTEERDNLKDSLLRKQAEFENFRKRTDRERSEFVKFASGELMREVLNVLDSLELALGKEDSSDGEVEDVRKGFELIYKQLVDSLKRFGLEAIEAKGRPFDPNVHEAVSTQPSDEVADGTVLEELRRGYLLHGKLLRPAMVTVAASSSDGSTEGSDG